MSTPKSLLATAGLIATTLLGWGASSVRADTVRDRLWVWGLPAGVFNDCFSHHLHRKTTIEPVAGAERMGLKNMIYVRLGGQPEPPFENYYQPFGKLDRVYWSLVSAGGGTCRRSARRATAWPRSTRTSSASSSDDLRCAPRCGNAADPLPAAEAARLLFVASLTPAESAAGPCKVRGQKLPIMAVGANTMQVKPQARAHIAEVDELCLWTWRPADLKNLEANFAALEKLAPQKRLFLGLLRVRLQ